jgi:hypothetical protein
MSKFLKKERVFDILEPFSHKIAIKNIENGKKYQNINRNDRYFDIKYQKSLILCFSLIVLTNMHQSSPLKSIQFAFFTKTQAMWNKNDVNTPPTKCLTESAISLGNLQGSKRNRTGNSARLHNVSECQDSFRVIHQIVDGVIIK